jgi:hypothetical protein
MNASSQAGAQCGVGLGANLSVRTPKSPAGQRTPLSGSAVLTSSDERLYSTDATHDRVVGSSAPLGLRQYNPRAGLVTLSKPFDCVVTSTGSVLRDTSGGTT